MIEATSHPLSPAIVGYCVAGRRRVQALLAAWRNLHGRIETGYLQIEQESSYNSAIVARGLSQRPGPSAFGPKR